MLSIGMGDLDFSFCKLEDGEEIGACNKPALDRRLKEYTKPSNIDMAITTCNCDLGDNEEMAAPEEGVLVGAM